ncbi:MAG: hypothetical protein WA652_01460, partial [Xanthobacteraceae bacterium]
MGTARRKGGSGNRGRPVTGEGSGLNVGYATAYGLWRPLADQGDADAQSSIGNMYELGTGVLKNYAEALKWYRLAA